MTHDVNDRKFEHVIDLILPYTDVCNSIALYTQCFPSVCGKTSQATRAGFESTTSCLISRRLNLSTTELAQWR